MPSTAKKNNAGHCRQQERLPDRGKAQPANTVPPDRKHRGRQGQPKQLPCHPGGEQGQDGMEEHGGEQLHRSHSQGLERAEASGRGAQDSDRKRQTTGRDGLLHQQQGWQCLPVRRRSKGPLGNRELPPLGKGRDFQGRRIQDKNGQCPTEHINDKKHRYQHF